MAAEHGAAHVIDGELLGALEAQLEARPVVAARQDVIRNIAGYCAVKGADLPDSLLVPDVFGYDSLTELVSPSPIQHAGPVCKKYISKQFGAINQVLGNIDPRQDADTLAQGTTEAVLLEADKRIEQYSALMQALGKPIEPLAHIEQDEFHQRRFIMDYVTVKPLPDQTPEELRTDMVSRGLLVARVQINVERDVVQQVIDGEPLSGLTLSIPERKTSALRLWFRRKFARKLPTNS